MFILDNDTVYIYVDLSESSPLKPLASDAVSFLHFCSVYSTCEHLSYTYIIPVT